MSDILSESEAAEIGTSLGDVTQFLDKNREMTDEDVAQLFKFFENAKRLETYLKNGNTIPPSKKYIASNQHTWVPIFQEHMGKQGQFNNFMREEKLLDKAKRDYAALEKLYKEYQSSVHTIQLGKLYGQTTKPDKLIQSKLEINKTADCQKKTGTSDSKLIDVYNGDDARGYTSKIVTHDEISNILWPQFRHTSAVYDYTLGDTEVNNLATNAIHVNRQLDYDVPDENIETQLDFYMSLLFDAFLMYVYCPHYTWSKNQTGGVGGTGKRPVRKQPAPPSAAPPSAPRPPSTGFEDMKKKLKVNQHVLLRKFKDTMKTENISPGTIYENLFYLVFYVYTNLFKGDVLKDRKREDTSGGVDRIEENKRNISDLLQNVAVICDHEEKGVWETLKLSVPRDTFTKNRKQDGTIKTTDKDFLRDSKTGPEFEAPTDDFLFDTYNIFKDFKRKTDETIQGSDADKMIKGMSSLYCFLISQANDRLKLAVDRDSLYKKMVASTYVSKTYVNHYAAATKKMLTSVMQPTNPYSKHALGVMCSCMFFNILKEDMENNEFWTTTIDDKHIASIYSNEISMFDMSTRVFVEQYAYSAQLIKYSIYATKNEFMDRQWLNSVNITNVTIEKIMWDLFRYYQFISDKRQRYENQYLEWRTKQKGDMKDTEWEELVRNDSKRDYVDQILSYRKWSMSVTDKTQMDLYTAWLNAEKKKYVKNEGNNEDDWNEESSKQTYTFLAWGSISKHELQGKVIEDNDKNEEMVNNAVKSTHQDATSIKKAIQVIASDVFGNSRTPVKDMNIWTTELLLDESTLPFAFHQYNWSKPIHQTEDIKTKIEKHASDINVIELDADSNAITYLTCNDICSNTIQDNKIDCIPKDKTKCQACFTNIYDLPSDEGSDLNDKSKPIRDIARDMMINQTIYYKQGIMIMSFGGSGVGKTSLLFGIPGQREGLIENLFRGIFENYPFHGTGRRFRLYAYEVYGNSKTSHVFNLYSPAKKKFSPNTKKITVTHQPHNPNVEFSKEFKDSETSLNNTDKTMLYPLFESDTDEEIKVKTLVDSIKAADQAFKTNRVVPYKIDETTTISERVRSTVNNPESSRSTMIYRLEIIYGDLDNEITIPICLVDLPGYELIDSDDTKYINENITKAFDYLQEKNTDFITRMCLGTATEKFRTSAFVIANTMGANPVKLDALRSACIDTDKSPAVLHENNANIFTKEEQFRVRVSRLLLPYLSEKYKGTLSNHTQMQSWKYIHGRPVEYGNKTISAQEQAAQHSSLLTDTSKIHWNNTAVFLSDRMREYYMWLQRDQRFFIDKYRKGISDIASESLSK
nr:hypothetical protein TetV2_00191 [Oceanusvirus sp.]